MLRPHSSNSLKSTKIADEPLASNITGNIVLHAVVHVCTHSSPHGMCGGQSDTEADLSPHNSVSPCQLPFHHCFILIQLTSRSSIIGSLVSAVIQDCVSGCFI